MDALNNLMPEWFRTLGPMGWPLLGCSALLTSVLLNRLYSAFTSSKRPARRAEQIWAEVQSFGEEPAARRSERLEMAMEEHEHQLFQGLSTLKALATISPMIGLLGTVIGIMYSFRKIAENQGPVTPGLIADGLWQAMSTTAFGIGIAIIALIVSFFVSRYAEESYRSLAIDLNKRSLAGEKPQNHQSPVSGADMEKWQGAKD